MNTSEYISATSWDIIHTAYLIECSRRVSGITFIMHAHSKKWKSVGSKWTEESKRQVTFDEILILEKYCCSAILLKRHSSVTNITYRGSDRVRVFKATFNNISVISWRSVLLVEETGIPGVSYRHFADKLYHSVG